MFFTKPYHDKIVKYIECKINNENTLILYQLARIYELPSLAKYIFISYITGSFTSLAETASFKKFDDFILERLFANPYISNAELIKAAHSWLSKEIEKRRKFAQQFLIKSRLHLLSDHVLKDVLNHIASFTCIDECVVIIIEEIKFRKRYPKSLSTKTDINK